MAGMSVRALAGRYPDEVEGTAIVEGSHEDQSARGRASARRAKRIAYFKHACACVDAWKVNL